MKRKKIIKTIVLALFVILICFFLYNFISYFRTGKQKINVSTTSQVYSNSNIEAIIDVDDKNNNSIKSKVKIELLDSDGRRVKGIKKSYQKEENKNIEVSIPVPSEVKTGKYQLKVTSNSNFGIYKEILKVPINLINGNEPKTIISLDKGIYKPGDNVNFRALLISERENIPIEKNAHIYIYDGNDNKVYSKEIETSEYGIISGNFKLGNEVNSGTYRLVVSTDRNEITKKFVVNPYIIPQFEVNIITDKEYYIVGENANITVQSKYFFGEMVSNATATVNIGEEEFKGITDKEGNFAIEYKISESGKLDIKANVIDTSNYLVEGSKTVFSSTDLFKLEVIPEYGNLIKNIDNDVYIITTTTDGKPLKTNSLIKIGNIVRQVITDENGIGSFTLTMSDLQEIGEKEINILSEDSEGRKISKSENISIVRNNGTIINTDKLKYNVGDDIELSLISNIDINSKTIYFYKGNELIKALTSENDNAVVNLENISGLIDIYVDDSNVKLNDSNKYKKTIFIKPNKKLNISINTDSEQYLPGDKLNIEFETKDEADNQIDCALLVSILDEAILNLAENDLSIDNIKIALEDIELYDGITAADLYANVIDDSSESLLKTLLLKQEYTDYNISKTANQIGVGNKDYLEKAMYSFIILIIIILIWSFTKFGKSEKFARFIAHSANMLAIFFIMLVVLYEPVNELYYSILDSYKLIDTFTILTNVVLTFVLYTLVLYKQRDYIFELIIELGVIPAVYLLVIFVLARLIDIKELIIVALLVLLVVWAILVSKSRVKELNRKQAFFKYTLTQLFKGLIVIVAIGLLNTIFYSPMCIWIILGIYIFIDKYIFGKTKIKMTGNKINLNVTGNELIVSGIGILFIVVLFTGISIIVRNLATIKINDNRYFGDINYNEGVVLENGIDYITKATENSDSIVKNGINIFEDSSSQKVQEEILEVNKEIENEKTQEVIENVRNIFLESLAFIPELITENGKANVSIDISDNITTWNIQTVGNSKNGNLGYSSKQFKVFKEYFVDFSLPTNSVVTDKVEIPVTLYNYTQSDLNIEVNVKENDWSNIGEYQKNVNVPANSTNMIYVPIEITKSGNNTLRIESKAENVSDIVEKNIQVTENGMEIQEIVSSGTMQNSLSQDIIYKENVVGENKKLKIKLYPSSINQVIDNMESILKLPTGCFEQTSSSLYPDILVLKYLKNNNLDNQEIKTKALEYISAGYQKLLTYEVKGTKGGYSLYGGNPAEPVITAFGLMEMNELSEVYEIDENVVENMKQYLFSQQKINGNFDYDSTYIGNTESEDNLAINAYIIWALSEVCPEDARIDKSVQYLVKNIDKAKDSYTLALMANVFINTNEIQEGKKVINKLVEKIIINDDIAYVDSSISDYYGTKRKYQNLQSTALMSMALSKSESNNKTNQALINYIIKAKSANGTWGTTQSTILGLKAINQYEKNSDVSNQTIKVKVNNDIKSIDIDKNNLDVYEFTFENVSNENKISIEMKKGKITYEILKQYYKPYEELTFNQDTSSANRIMIEQTITKQAKINDEIIQDIHVVNKAGEDILNGLVQINIPQGCSVNEQSLMMLKHNGTIEKYEYNYGKINLYLRNFKIDNEISLVIKYRALYPEIVTGGAVRIFDYYNPEIQSILSPQIITIEK